VPRGALGLGVGLRGGAKKRKVSGCQALCLVCKKVSKKQWELRGTNPTERKGQLPEVRGDAWGKVRRSKWDNSFATWPGREE